jgi:hypothetical protein
MIKKTITFEDYNGDERTKDFYFHMNQVEFSKLNGEIPGGIEKRMQKIIEDRDEDALLRIIDLIVSRSYGEFDDADEFTKVSKTGRPLYEKFVNTDAYDQLIIELIQNENNIVTFLKSIMPKKVQGRIDEEMQKRQNEADQAVKLTPVKADSSSKVE